MRWRPLAGSVVTVTLLSPGRQEGAEAQGNTTRVTITEHGEVYNPIFRFISKYIMGHNGTMDAYLTALGMKFGTPVVPTDGAPVPLK